LTVDREWLVLMVWLDKQGGDLMSLIPQALVAADRVAGAEET
jgi:hypothetical protein